MCQIFQNFTPYSRVKKFETNILLKPDSECKVYG